MKRPPPDLPFRAVRLFSLEIQIHMFSLAEEAREAAAAFRGRD